MKLFDIVSPQGMCVVAIFDVVNLSMDYTKLNPICMIMDYVDHDMWGILQLAKECKLPMYSPLDVIHVKILCNSCKVVYVPIVECTIIPSQKHDHAP